MSILRLILGIVLGLVVGSVVNMALVMAGGHVIPLPPGADMTTAEGIRAALPRLEPRHFLFPFLAHALGTLVGAYVAARVASRHKLIGALVVGALSLAGGVMAARMFPAPTWFIAADLICAYVPFAWLGYLLARPRQKAPAHVAWQLAPTDAAPRRGWTRASGRAQATPQSPLKITMETHREMAWPG